MKFDISNNQIRVDGTKALAAALKGNNVLSELNVASNALIYPGNGSTDMSGVIAISDAIPTMGAMTSLNLASNKLGADGATHIAEAVKVHVSALRFVWYYFALDLTFGSTAVVYEFFL